MTGQRIVAAGGVKNDKIAIDSISGGKCFEPLNIATLKHRKAHIWQTNLAASLGLLAIFQITE